MRKIRSRGYQRMDTITWELDGNQLEFTRVEFQELLLQIRGVGLFAALSRDRPALLGQLLAILGPPPEDPEEEKELEYLLEQALFGIEQALPR